MTAEASLKITADNSEFVAKMKESQKVVTESFERMKGTIEAFTGIFEKVNVAMAAFTAVLAGGKAFKEAVSASVEAATEASKLGRELGITATQASVLRVAMAENFVPMEAVEAAANKIATAIKKNPEEFARMGVAIRDSSGHLRNSYDIMTDVNEKLAEMKEGTARNVEGIRIYGKAWPEIAPTLRLTKEAMEEARVSAANLHLIVGKEGILQTMGYRKALEGAHATLEAVEKSIGDALVPVLTEMGEWFASVGPTAVNIMRGALVVLVAGVERFKFVWLSSWETIKGWLEIVSTAIVGNLKAVAAFLMNPFSGDAVQIWEKTFADIEAKARARAANIKQIWADSSKAIDQFTERMASPETPTGEKTGKDAATDDTAGKDQIAKLEAVLNAKKIAYQADAAAHGELLTFSYQQELEYWQKIQGLASTNAETRASVEKKIQELTLNEQRKTLEGKLAALKTDAEAHGKNLEARLAAEMKYAAAVATIYRDDPKKYQEAQAQIIATKQAIIEQQRKIDSIQIQSDRDVQMAAINTAKSVADEQYSLKKISLQQLLALERQYQAEKYQLELKAAAEQLAIADPDNAQDYSEKLAKIRALAAENQTQLQVINQKGTAEQMALTEKLTNSMTQGFSNAFSGILKGTETLHKAMTQIYSNMVTLVVNALAKILSQTIATHLVEMTQTKEQQAADATAGAVAAGKSAAAIPVVGWSLSLGAMASFLAAATGLGSAEGGYDIPAGTNPLTQLHQREMVLPAPIADPLREALAKGQLGGSGNGMTLNIKANDARSFERQLRQNGSLTKVLRDLHRRMQR